MTTLHGPDSLLRRHEFWPQMMAGSMVVILSILVIFIFVQRYFIEGVSGSAVKG